MKLLITGIPGTGKTTIGNYLQTAERYEHFDMEKGGFRSQEEFGAAINAFLTKAGENKVITWGFVPGASDGAIKHFQQRGYKMIWFDGNRDAARKAFLKRGDVPEQLLNLQMARIDALNLAIFNPVVLDTFDRHGEFLEEKAIVELIFKMCG
jgi:adenylate kinase family enzyme